jgi:bla regulator protein BlaR1
MASFQDVFSSNIVSALCGMILHSLWQGGLLAACVGLILVFTKNKPSLYRYNLLIGSLALFFAATVYTFINGIISLTSNTAAIPGSGKATSLLASGNGQIQIMQMSFMDSIVMYLNAHSFFIVCAWFIIVCLRSLQLAIGMRGVFLLRYKAVTPVSLFWQLRVRQLSQKMGITSAIHIMESGIAKVPMVIGHLKPLILIPLGMLAKLPQEELEAILVHELAHIRRKDYLVNILQSLVELAFFFNPAVLWTSSLIRKEREHCCDDITIEMANSKTIYIKALVSTQEYAHHLPAYAMALNGRKKHLLSRVKRLAFNDQKPITYLEKSILAVGVLMLALAISFFSYGGKKEMPRRTVTTTTTTVTDDSEDVTATSSHKETIKIYKPSDVGNGTTMKYVGNQQSAYLLKENNVLYQLFIKEGNPDVLFIDGQKIAANKMPAYSATIQKLMMLYNKEQEAKETTETAAIAAPIAQTTNRNQTKTISIPVNIDIALPVSPEIADERRPVATAVMPVNPVAHTNETYKSEDLIADMLKDHIISEKGDTLSFKLSTNEFVVNGEKQSDLVYGKYKTKYIKTTGNSEVTWYYNYNTSNEYH